MTSQWIVVMEAALDGSAGIQEGTLSGLMAAVSDANPVALYNPDRCAVQLEVTAGSPQEALQSAMQRWSEAVVSLGAPPWEVVRVDVMTAAELQSDLEIEPPPVADAPAPSDDWASERRWRLVLQDASGLVILLAADGTVLSSLPPLESGLSPSTGGETRTLAGMVHPDDAEVVADAVATIRAGEAETVNFLMRCRREGGWRLYEATARNLLEEPLVRAIVLNGQDITRRQELEDRLAELASHDELTGLVNRAAFLDTLELTLARSEGRADTAVFFVDIDNFCGLVDRAGADVGERLLVTIAERLRTEICEDAVAARLGRDEFALLCNNVAGSAEATQIARRLADRLSAPVQAGDEDISVTVSIGVALESSGRLQAATLLRHAEVAMYRARRGRARYEIFRRKRSPTGHA